MFQTLGLLGTESILGMEKMFRKSRRKRTGLPSRLQKGPVGWRVRRGTSGVLERDFKSPCPSAVLGEWLCGMLASGARTASHKFSYAPGVLKQQFSTLGSLDHTSSHLSHGRQSTLVPTFSPFFTLSGLHGPFCSGTSLLLLLCQASGVAGVFCACTLC